MHPLVCKCAVELFFLAFFPQSSSCEIRWSKTALLCGEQLQGCALFTLVPLERPVDSG